MKIRVNAGELGWVIIGRMTYTEGEHELWNEEIKEWPDFKRLVDEGKVELIS